MILDSILEIKVGTDEQLFMLKDVPELPTKDIENLQLDICSIIRNLNSDDALLKLYATESISFTKDIKIAVDKLINYAQQWKLLALQLFESGLKVDFETFIDYTNLQEEEIEKLKNLSK